MLDALSFDTSGWDEQSREPHVRRWKNRVNGDGLGLYYFAIPPDIKTPLKQVDQLRHHLRLSLAQSNGGIIEHAVIQLAGIPVIRQIVKIRQDSMLYYIGSWTFPRRDFSYVLKIQCQERGITGQREALVLDRELAHGRLQPTPEGMKSWVADPYDPTFQQGILRNLAEDEQYDAEFPDHPLSRLRRYFQQIEPTIAVADALKQSPEFRGPKTTRRTWW